MSRIKVKNIISGTTSVVATIFIVIGIIILAAALSLAVFALGYWLITLILATFFNFVLPFSWWYALGGWLICLVVYLFIAPGLFVAGRNRD